MSFKDLIGNHMRSDIGLEGYWGPKSSSVNFCEEDYAHSHYIAEFHNTWTSLLFIALPLLGLLRSNPTKEWRFVWVYVQLMVTGAGSMILHATLTSVGQKFDEIPMLWMCSAIFYNFLVMNQKYTEGFCKWTLLIPLFVIYQTVIYVWFQSQYWIFIAGYVAMVIGIIVWTGYLCLPAAEKVHSYLPIRRWLWSRAVSLYVAAGVIAWLVDMHFCDALSPYIRALGGMTFHVLWHIGAAYGTYLICLFIVAVRCQRLGMLPEVTWTPLAPIITVKVAPDFEKMQ